MKERVQGLTIEEIQKQLQWEERHDEQTGTVKVAYLDTFSNVFENKYVHIAYIHIHGFSHLFDMKGYGACDEVLHVCGYMLIDYFGEDRVFRVGLDNFLVITESYQETWKFIDKLEEYRNFITSFEYTLSKPELKIFVGFTKGIVTKEDDIEMMVEICKQRQIVAYQNNLYYVDADVKELDQIARYSSDERTDYLTGLLTMDAFIEYAKKIIDTSFTKDLSKVILYFNIENFKGYNENYGFEKGNELIKELGVQLKKVFPNRLISRFAEDHFLVLTYEAEVEERIEVVAQYFSKRYISVKAGIYVVDSLASKNITVACDKAKIACDAIKRKYNIHYNYFNSEMDSMIRLEQYIVDHIDEAIRKKWIKIYFQPVVRTLSKTVCGFEALSRWDDPQVGMIRPDVFIDILERYHLITKLSEYIVDCLCERYAYYHSKCKLVPVSINLSILDFETPNLLEKIDEKLTKRNVPRELLQIEVTESLLSSNQEFMQEQIIKFNEVGYSVWLDDFGSGYSSLNVLKDYQVDTLKIDMMFLRNFTSRSKTILELVVNMAKALGIHTLAEGVETKEHFDFLRSIGCEKIQGYYFGRPEPLDIILKKVIDGELEIEDQGQRFYYRDIGKVNMLSNNPFGDEQFNQTNIPIGIFQQIEDHFEVLYANEAVLNELTTLGFKSLDDFRLRLQDKENPNVNRILVALDSLEYGEETRIDLIRGGNLMTLRYKNVAMTKDRKAYLMTVRNLSRDNFVLRQMRLDETKQTIYALFDQVYLIDLRKNVVETIYTHVGVKKKKLIIDVKELIEKMGNTMVYIDDQERFYEFMDLSDIDNRLDKNHVISEAFRYTEDNTVFKWRIFELSFANNKDELIFSIRPLDESKKKSYLSHYGYDTTPTKKTGLTEAALWNTLKDQVPVGIFWKDTDRRFVGVNKTFREFYNIKSLKDIIGKNDEEMGWHVDPDPFKNDEIRVLRKGERTHDVPGKCLSKGENRDIAASKMPVYNDGKIVGLLGYFVDITDEKKRIEAFKLLGNHDPEIGMLNWNGIMANGLHFIESYRLRNQEFMVVYINVGNVIYYNRLHGKEVLIHMLKKVGKKISEYIGVTGVAGYLGMGKFIILKQFNKCEDMEVVKKELLDKVSTVTTVDRISFTLRFNIGICAFSETDDMELAFKLAQQRAMDTHQIDVEDNDVYKQIASEMNKYHDLFDFVRCIDIDTYKTYINDNDTLKEEGKCCYEFFDKTKPCRNCIAKKSLITHDECVKVIHGDIPHVAFMRAMTFKDKHYVIVFVKKLDNSN